MNPSALTDRERGLLRDRALWSQSGGLFAAVEWIIRERTTQAWDSAHGNLCVVAGQMQCTLHANPYRVISPGKAGDDE